MWWTTLIWLPHICQKCGNASMNCTISNGSGQTCIYWSPSTKAVIPVEAMENTTQWHGTMILMAEEVFIPHWGTTINHGKTLYTCNTYWEALNTRWARNS